jgi:hypothetical protein
MNPTLIASLVRVSALAVETLCDYLRQPPADAAEAAEQDRAVLALMDQQQRIADALRDRIGVPEPVPPAPAGPAGGDDLNSSGETDRKRCRQATALSSVADG